MNLLIYELIGTAIFAITGVVAVKRYGLFRERFSANYKFSLDIFGILFAGTLTAIGGGTLRDLLLGVDIFWIEEPLYIYWAIGSTLVFLCFYDLLSEKCINYTMPYLDAMGLSLFAILGAAKAFSLESNVLIVAMMGMITGVVGGITRDVFVREIPFIFYKDLYATPPFIGSFLFAVIATYLGNSNGLMYASILFVFIFRSIAIFYEE